MIVWEKRHCALWITQHEIIQVSIYFTWVFPVSWLALLPCFGSCPLLSLKQKPRHQEILQGCSIFQRESYSSELWILLWVHLVLDLTSNFNMLCPCAHTIKLSTKIRKVQWIWEKMPENRQLECLIALPRSRGCAVKLPTAAISRAVLYFRRWGFFCAGKTSTCLAALTWGTSHAGIAPVRREIPVLSSAFPAKFSPYCITFKYCYCNEDGYRQHQEEENQQPIPKWCI